MWWPVLSPLPEHRISPPFQMLYLFVQTIAPTVPASFLTFGATPLYHFYATRPRLYGVTALDDQQVAGLTMKLGGGFLLYGIIGVIFFFWYISEERPGVAPAGRDAAAEVSPGKALPPPAGEHAELLSSGSSAPRPRHSSPDLVEISRRR
jgi:putative membrane protein